MKRFNSALLHGLLLAVLTLVPVSLFSSVGEQGGGQPKVEKAGISVGWYHGGPRYNRWYGRGYGYGGYRPWWGGGYGYGYGYPRYYSPYYSYYW